MLPLLEARRDGRLDERERAALERHLPACAGCRDRDAELTQLAALARAPSATTTPLEHRRGRLRLLQAAAVLETHADRRSSLSGYSAAVAHPSRGWRAPLAAAAVALTLLAAGASRSRIDAATPSGAHAAGAPGGGAPAPGAIEAPGSAPTVISPALPPPANATRTATSAKPPAAPLKRTTAPPRPPPAQPEAAQPEAAPPPAAGGGELGGGIDALSRGDFGAAAEQLQAFRQAHPEDARAEDAAFLTILALDRAGKHTAARQAAREYLGVYPRGFRRAEAGAIAARAAD
jgi:hypothetical protein